MREEFKKTTPWVFTKDGNVIRYDYGFTCFQGNQGPYFSITGEEWRARRGSEPLPAGRDCLSCGCLHDYIPKALAFLRPAIPFHLFDPDHGPMHYEADALFRLHQADGEHTDDRIYRVGEHDPDPMVCFKSHVCFGLLPTDAESELQSLLIISDDGRKLWLRNRLPALREKFIETVVKGLGLETEYENARLQYQGR